MVKYWLSYIGAKGADTRWIWSYLIDLIESKNWYINQDHKSQFDLESNNLV